MFVFHLLSVAALTATAAAYAAVPDPAAAPVSAATTEPAAAADVAATPAPTIADTIKADWAKYDTGNKGTLTKAEFSKWMGDLRTTAGQPAPDAAWLKTAFAQTDTDKNAKVSAAELTAFLSAGA
jgi:hypothetical protein